MAVSTSKALGFWYVKSVNLEYLLVGFVNIPRSEDKEAVAVVSDVRRDPAEKINFKLSLLS